MRPQKSQILTLKTLTVTVPARIFRSSQTPAQLYLGFDFRKTSILQSTTVPNMHSAKLKSFLDLPAEIRNQVYALAIPTCQSFNISSYTPQRRSPFLPLVSLLQTCHQIYSEVTPIVYGSNTFTICSPSKLQAWLSSIGPRASHLLRKLVIDYDSSAELTLSLIYLEQHRISPDMRLILRASIWSPCHWESTPATHLIRGSKVGEYLKAFVGRLSKCEELERLWETASEGATLAWREYVRDETEVFMKRAMRDFDRAEWREG